MSSTRIASRAAWQQGLQGTPAFCARSWSARGRRGLPASRSINRAACISGRRSRARSTLARLIAVAAVTFAFIYMLAMAMRMRNWFGR